MVSGGTDYESPTLWISRPGGLPGNPPEAVPGTLKLGVSGRVPWAAGNFPR